MHTKHTRSGRAWLRSLFLVLALLLAPLSLAVTPALAASGDCVTASGLTTCTFTYTGAAQTWIVPNGVTSATFDLYGAQGGDGTFAFVGLQLGGRGGAARATFAVTSGQTYQINVGSRGTDVARVVAGRPGAFGGGGDGRAGFADESSTILPGGASGGGASDVRGGGFSLDERIIVAGGGGGGGGAAGGGGGGAGGDLSGVNGENSFSGNGGAGGSQAAGGAGGVGTLGGGSGTSGGQGNGGDGGQGNGGGGGGGGGYYGGDGGQGNGSGGGGGGSGYGPAGVVFESGVRSGSGQVSVSYAALDSAAPTASPSQSPAANANGWNNTDVTMRWNWTDADSGIDSANCTTSSTSSSEGAQTLSASCADTVGNTGSASYSIKVDKTVPTISAAAISSPNANGWYKGDLTVHFTCNDTLSGVANCPADQILTSEGANVPSTAQTTSDMAGNISTASNIVTVKIDRSAPTVSVTGVTNGASYPLGSVPAAACSTSDALSGVATQATLSISGGNADGTGSFTATCSGAADLAGNSGSASISYTVAYRWSGFFQPVDNLPTVNSVKAGSAVPVKFSLGGNYGLNIFASGYPKVQVVSCSSGAPTDEIEQTDKSWAGSCRQLVIKLIDGTEHIAAFQFR